jgi:hypothetical protein
MLAALGAVSTIFDALKSLSSSTATSSQVTTGFTQNTTAFSATTTTSTATNAPVISGGGSTVGNLSPDTLNALFATQGEPPVKSKADALSDLFGLLDADGSGRISKSEFEGALGAGGTNTAAADRVFGKLDTDGDGAVSADELAAALTTPKKKDDHRPESASVNDPLKKALSGASTTTTSNSDGSVTTTVTYADGSKVTLTSPPSNAASNAASSSYNFVEQAIQRQAQAISASAAASVSVSA